MTRVEILSDKSPYNAVDYEARLVGWVHLPTGIHAIVFMNDGDEPWTEPIDRVRIKL